MEKKRWWKEGNNGREKAVKGGERMEGKGGGREKEKGL